MEKVPTPSIELSEVVQLPEPMEQQVPEPSNQFLKPNDDARRRRSPSPKRRSGEYTHGAGYLNLDERSDVGSTRRIKKKLAREAEKELELYARALGNKAILKACLEHLSNQDLKRVAFVSKDWLDTSITVRRARLQNKPFILVWTDSENSAQDEEKLQENFILHFRDSWFRGVGTVEPIDTIICFSTSFFVVEAEDFFKVPAIRDGNVKFIYAAGGHLTCTLPESNNTRRFIRFSNSTSAFTVQTLCVPKNPDIEFLSMSIPSSTAETKSDVVTTLVNRHHYSRDYLTDSCGKSLKGLLMFVYLDDELAKEFAESYCTGAGMGNPSGIIVASQDGVCSSDTSARSTVASLLAIHGSENLRLAAYGFRMTTGNILSLGDAAKKFFAGAKNKFIVMVYRFFVETDKQLALMKEAIGDDVPIVGIETYNPIMFYGNRFGFPSADEIEVALFLVAY